MESKFNEHLKRIRKVYRTTQQDLADYLNVSVQSVSKWEKGDALPSIEYLPKIAEFYNCSVNAFFSDYEMQAFEQFAPLTQEQEISLLTAVLKHAGLFIDIEEKEEQGIKVDPEETLPVESLFLPALYDILKNTDTLYCSQLQRYLGIGFGLSARMMHALEDMEIVVFNQDKTERVVVKEKIDLLIPYFAYNKVATK